jgi:hypothetical protein
MSREGVKPKTLLDTQFVPPPGSEENFTQVNPPAPRPTTRDNPGIGIGMPIPVTGVDNESAFYLDTPDTIIIFDQKLRRAPGGQQVVDVTIDVEEIIGALEYEVQIAKVD